MYNMYLSATIMAAYYITERITVLHRTITAFVGLINDIDRGLSYFLLCSILLIGGAAVGLAAHLTGVISWLWNAGALNPDVTTYERIMIVGTFVGIPIMVALWYILDFYYQRAGTRRYERAMASAGHPLNGGLSYGLGYWSYQVGDNDPVRSRFAPV